MTRDLEALTIAEPDLSNLEIGQKEGDGRSIILRHCKRWRLFWVQAVKSVNPKNRALLTYCVWRGKCGEGSFAQRRSHCITIRPIMEQLPMSNKPVSGRPRAKQEARGNKDEPSVVLEACASQPELELVSQRGTHATFHVGCSSDADVSADEVCRVKRD